MELQRRWVGVAEELGHLVQAFRQPRTKTMVLVAGTVLTTARLLGILWRRHRVMLQAAEIPGPRASFFFGNMSIMQLPKMRSLRAQLFQELCVEYGPVVRIVMPIFFTGPYNMMVIFGDREQIEKVLHDPNCQSRPGGNGGSGDRDSLPIGPSLIGMGDNAVHHAHRKALSPLFTKRMLASYATTILATLSATEEALRRAAPQGPQNMHALLVAATYDIISAIGFNKPVRTVNNLDDPAIKAGDRWLFANLQRATNPLNRLNYLLTARLRRWLHRIVGPALVSLPPIDKEAAYFANLLLPMVKDQRAKAEAAGGDDSNQKTMIGKAVAFKDESGSSLNDREVMGELLGLLLAGHETTANTLTWAILLLARHPEAQERVAAEARQLELGQEAVENLSFTRKVFYEALRLYPTVPSLARRNHTEFTVAGLGGKEHQIPAEQFLMLNFYSFAPTARPFDPDKAPSGGIQAGKDFFPFGGGQRVCLGWQLAELEGTLLLAGLARAFRFEDAGRPVELFQDITLGPKHTGCFLKVVAR